MIIIIAMCVIFILGIIATYIAVKYELNRGKSMSDILLSAGCGSMLAILFAILFW